MDRPRSAGSIHPEQAPQARVLGLEFPNATRQLVPGIIDRRHRPILAGRQTVGDGLSGSVLRASESYAGCITFCDTLRTMGHAVSVRLDDEVQRALRTLEASGLSRSEAIRKSILDAAAALRRQETLRSEVAALEADEADRREMHEVASLMESIRAER